MKGKGMHGKDGGKHPSQRKPAKAEKSVARSKANKERIDKGAGRAARQDRVSNANVPGGDGRA
jgi:hypothetical protein